MYELHTADPPWEVNNHSACPISHLLQNQNVHHHVHTSTKTAKYPQPHGSRPNFHLHKTKIHLKLSFHRHSDFTYGPFLTLKYSNYKCMWTSALSYTGCTSNTFHPLWFHHPNNFLRRVKTMAFLIKKYSPVSCYAMWRKVWLLSYQIMYTTKYSCA